MFDARGFAFVAPNLPRSYFDLPLKNLVGVAARRRMPEELHELEGLRVEVPERGQPR
jgi:hypothetical protein